MSCLHSQKTEAFALQRLQGEERSAFAAHLPGCASCTAAVRELAPVGRALSAYRPFEPDDLSELELARIDRNVGAAMDRALTTPAPFDFGALLRFAAVGMVTALALFTVLRPADPTPGLAVVVAPAPQLAALAVGHGLDAVVIDAQHQERLLAEAPLVAGDVVKSASGSVTVQTSPATGVHLPKGTVLALERLEKDHTALRLLEGTLLAEVKPLAPGASFEVRCDDLLVAVRGTAFVVQRLERSIVVEVAHGLVQVSREGTADAVLVPGGTRLEIAAGAPLQALSPLPLEKPRREFPLGFEDRPVALVLESGHALPLQSNPQGARVRVDGRFRGTTPLTALEGDGPHTVIFELDGRPPAELSLTAGQLPGGMVLVPEPALDATAQRLGDAPKLQTVRDPKSSLRGGAPHKEIENPETARRRKALQYEVGVHKADLKSCFERAGKRNPKLVEQTGEIIISLTLDGSGAVKELSAGENTDPWFLECSSAVIRTFGVPGTGEDEFFEIPLLLKPQ